MSIEMNKSIESAIEDFIYENSNSHNKENKLFIGYVNNSSDYALKEINESYFAAHITKQADIYTREQIIQAVILMRNDASIDSFTNKMNKALNSIINKLAS